jgi:hypothetical protein
MLEQGIVRRHMNACLGIKNDGDIIWADVEPSAQDVERYEEDDAIEGPTLDPMQPCWDNLDSIWNDRLGELLVDHLKLAEEDLCSEDEPIIEEMFRNRLQRLKRMRLAALPRHGEEQKGVRERMATSKSAQLARQRVNSRRQTVSL